MINDLIITPTADVNKWGEKKLMYMINITLGGNSLVSLHNFENSF